MIRTGVPSGIWSPPESFEQTPSIVDITRKFLEKRTLEGLSGGVHLYLRAASATRSSRSQSRTGDWTTLNLAVGASVTGEGLGEHRFSIELANLTDKRYRPTPDELMQPGRAVRANWRSTF